MGISVTPFICYGFAINRNKLPWEDEESEEWWRKKNNYKNPYEDEHGKAKINDLDNWFDWLKKWDKDNPIPFGEMPWWNYDNDSIILFVPDSYIESEGYQELDIDNIQVSDESKLRFIQFCTKYEIEDDAKWLLCAVYG